MTYRYSFSSLARVERCPCSALLQQVDETSGYALDGRRKHSYLERAATVGRDAALAELPDDEREAAAAIDLAAMPWLQSGAAEVAFALDLEHGTARELGRGLARDYSGLRDGEVPGTLDWCGLVADDGVAVVDWKTGHYSPDANDNLQLLAGALSAALVHGRYHATTMIGKLLASGEWYFSVADLDAEALSDGLERLRKIDAGVRAAAAELAAGGHPRLAIGSWCDFCPAFRACPAHRAMFVQLREACAMVPDGEQMAITTPEEVRDLLPKWRAAKKFTDAVGEALRRVGAQMDVDLGDGQVWGKVPGDRVLDGNVAHRLLVEVAGQDRADEACPRSTSAKAIETALRPVAPPRGLGKFVRETTDRIWQESGEQREAPKVKEHKRKE